MTKRAAKKVVSCMSCGAEVHLRMGPDGKWRAVACQVCRQLVEG